MARDSIPTVTFPGRPARRAAAIALEGSRPAELLAALSEAERFDRDAALIAVDGGLSTCRAARKKPDLFVGDLDSTPAPPRGIPSNIFPVDKDFSDFSGALVEASRLGAGVVVIAGLLGGRLDHEWANLLELGAAASRFRGFLAPTARGLIAVTSTGARAGAASGRIVSVFALGGSARVSLTGTRWTLRQREITPGSLGLSNLSRGNVALTVHDGVAGLLFPRPGS
jgi:thiamine pyrophosphokinase